MIKVYHECEKCLKCTVCKLSANYINDITAIKAAKINMRSAIELDITCAEYYPKSEAMVHRSSLANQVE